MCKNPAFVEHYRKLILVQNETPRDVTSWCLNTFGLRETTIRESLLKVVNRSPNEKWNKSTGWTQPNK